MSNLLNKTQTTTAARTDAVYVAKDRLTAPVDRWMEIDDFFLSQTGNQSLLAYASLAAAVTALGSTQATIEIPASTTVSASLTVPYNITLRIQGTGQISVSSGQTLTINGPIEAPQREIFIGLGSVVVGFETVSPRWFGARGDAKIVTDGSMTASSAVLTSATAVFTSADVGKSVDVAGVGAAATLSAVIIAYTDSTHVELSISASYTGSSKTISLDSDTIATGSMTAGDPTLTAGSAFFTADDVGKLVRVTDVGAKNIAGTISGFTNSTTVTLSVSASATVSGRRVIYGTNDHQAIVDSVGALPNGGEIHFPKGLYVNGSQVTIATSNLVFSGAGKTATIIYSVGPIAGNAGSMYDSFHVDNGCSEIHFRDMSANGTNWSGQSPAFVANCDGVSIGTAGPINNISATRCAFNGHWSIGFHNGGSPSPLTFGRVTAVTNISLIDCEAAFNALDGFNPNPLSGLQVKQCYAHHNGTAGIESATAHAIIDMFAYHNFQGGASIGGYGGSEFGVDVVVTGNYQYNGIYGVTLGSNMRHCRLIGVDASNNGYQGLLVDATGGDDFNGYHVIDGCTANNNPNANIYLSAANCVVRNCVGTGSGVGLKVENNADNSVVENNGFVGNTKDYHFLGSTDNLFVCYTPTAVVDRTTSTFKAMVGQSGAADGFTTVTFSATPTFDAAIANTFKISLTANVTSSTLSNGVAGQLVTFIIVQDPASARTFVWPTNVFGETTIGTALGKFNVQSFRFDGTNWYAVAVGVIDQG
jgi:hypothetical protein